MHFRFLPKATLISLATLMFIVIFPSVPATDEIDESKFDAKELGKLKDALEKEETDEKSQLGEYRNPEFHPKPETYTCWQFARDINWNLWSKYGIFTKITNLQYHLNGKKGPGHFIIETTLKTKDGKRETVYINTYNDGIYTDPGSILSEIYGPGVGRRGNRITKLKIEESVGPVQLILSVKPPNYSESEEQGTIGVKDESFTVKFKAYKGKDRKNTVANQEVNYSITNPDGSVTDKDKDGKPLKAKTDKDGEVTITVPNQGHEKFPAVGKIIKVEVTIPGTDETRSTKVKILRNIRSSMVVPDGEEGGKTAYASVGDAGNTLAYPQMERIAVQTYEECVGTTYYLPPVIEEPIVHCAYGGPDEGLVVTNGEPVAVSVPEEDQGVPLCPKGPPPVITLTPPEDGKPPVTAVTETPPEKEEPPDIGLAKAAAEIVKLVLTGSETGQHVEGAVVKSLDAPPPLQLAGEVDPALTSSDAYASGVEAGFTGEDGEVIIGQDDTATQADEQAKSQLASMSLMEVKVEEEKKGRVVVAMDAVDTAADASSGEHKLPASLAQPGLDLCVAHSFHIGRHPVFIASLPAAQVDDFQRTARQTEGIYYAEKDPCRTIYERGSGEVLKSAD